MKCSNCNKDISAMHFFTKKYFCSKKCENSYNEKYKGDLPTGWRELFGKKM